MPKKPLVRVKEFNDYILWRNIPSVIRGLDPEDIRKKFGIEDEYIQKLARYRTQKEFAKQYTPPLSEDTLTDWNVLIEEEKLDRVGQNKWLAKLTANVKLALYGTAMKTGKAPEVSLFLEVAGDYIPKSEVITNPYDHKEETLDEIETAIKTKREKADEIKRRIAKLGGRGSSHRTRTKGAGRKATAKSATGTDSQPTEADL